MDLRELPSRAFQRHPWELARADFFCDVLSRRVLHGDLERILDVGAGDGFFASRLARLVADDTEIICNDARYDSSAEVRVGAQLPAKVQLTRELPNTRADLILLLDVLEHIEDDRAFLRHLVMRSLTTDGFILISVPAWPRLFSPHDVSLAHHRRYSPKQARALITECSLCIRECGGAFHSLLPLRALQIVANRLMSTSNAATDPSLSAAGGAKEVGNWRHGAWLSRGLLRALKIDNDLSRAFAARGIDMPGLTWWALCQLRDADRVAGA